MVGHTPLSPEIWTEIRKSSKLKGRREKGSLDHPQTLEEGLFDQESKKKLCIINLMGAIKGSKNL